MRAPPTRQLTMAAAISPEVNLNFEAVALVVQAGTVGLKAVDEEPVDEVPLERLVF